MSYRLLMLMPMFAMLVVAAIGDLRTRKIRNWLTFGLLISGIAQSFTASHTVTPTQSMLGMLVGFSLTFVLFALGALGGGDVKLLAGVGAWIGPMPVLAVFLAAAVVGMVIVLAQCAVQGRLTTLFRNSALLVINLAHTSDLGMHHVSQTGKSCRSVDKPLPYAVPVLIATALVVLR